jgi:Mrp family chromosome partitioning ATPase
MLVATPIAALASSKMQKPLYEGSASVLVNRVTVSSIINNTQPQPVDPTRSFLTQAQIARSTDVVTRAIASSGVSAVTVDSLLRNSSVTADANTYLLHFGVKNRSRAAAEALATSYAKEYTSYRQQLDTQALDRALQNTRAKIAGFLKRGASPTSPLVTNLQTLESDIEATAAAQTSNTQVLNSATPAKKIRPRTKRNVILAGLFGFVLSVGFALLAEALDRRVRSEREIEAILGLPLLAKASKPPRRLRNADQLVMLAKPTSTHAEAFRKLRTKIEFMNLEGRTRTIMVTSAVGLEGKSTTIANLAVALAWAGRRVVLVDLDLRRPLVSRLFRVAPRPGVTDVVLGGVPMADAVRSIAVGASADVYGKRIGSPNGLPANRRSRVEGVLSVLPAGPSPADTGEFVGLNELALLLDDLSERFDFVLVDAPPLLAVGDAMTLSGRVGAIVAVTRLGLVQRPLLHEFARQLETCRAEKLGFVLAGAELEQGYGYPYTYGYTPAEAEHAERMR